MSFLFPFWWIAFGIILGALRGRSCTICYVFYVFYSFFITYRLYYHHIVVPGHNIQQNRDLHGCTAFGLYIPSFWELSYRNWYYNIVTWPLAWLLIWGGRDVRLKCYTSQPSGLSILSSWITPTRSICSIEVDQMSNKSGLLQKWSMVGLCFLLVFPQNSPHLPTPKRGSSHHPVPETPCHHLLTAAIDIIYPSE